MPESESNRSVTLDQLAALNREIAALMRAGVPLEAGLTSLGGELPYDLRNVTDALASRLSAGEPLETAIDTVGTTLPGVYKAVMKAAVRSNRPAAALESLSSALAHVNTMRRSILAAMVYPILVATAAWLGFVLYGTFIGPRMWGLFDAFGLAGTTTGVIREVSRVAAQWGFIVPLVLFAMATWFWISRSGLVEPPFSRLLFGWIPFMPGVLRNTRAAAFLDILTILVESHIPFEEALRLAAEVTGDPKTVRSAHLLASQLEAGKPLKSNDFTQAGFPPMFGWLLTNGTARGNLLPSLRHAQATYRRRAQFHVDAVRGVAPVVCTGLIGGIIGIAFVLAVYLPYVSLMLSLS